MSRGKRRLKILIVEDSLENILLLKAYTQASEHQYVYVENGLEGLTEYQNDHDYDLIIMDIQMPHMDGHEATRHIRHWERTNRIFPTPIYALSAHTFQEDIENSLKAGCNGHLNKPIRKKDFLDFVNSFADLGESTNLQSS